MQEVKMRIGWREEGFDFLFFVLYVYFESLERVGFANEIGQLNF